MVVYPALTFNPLYTGGFFHCYMLDESIRHFRGVGSILSLLFYFWWKILLANSVDPDQMSHYVAFDLGLHCLPMTILRVFRSEWVKSLMVIYVHTRSGTKWKRVMNPNDCHCGETNCTGFTIQIYWFRPENNVLLMLIDNNFARNGCWTIYCYGTYINTHYWSLLMKFV